MFLINIQMFVNYKSLYFVFVGVCFFSRFPSTLCPCLEWTDADSQTNRRFCFAAFRRILRQILFFRYVSDAKIIVSRYCYYEVVWQFGRQILISSFFETHWVHTSPPRCLDGIGGKLGAKKIRWQKIETT